ncbi:MAG: DUF2723 domain-containing protein [Deltaproteobacteria bacterium]|nr:DUF2723 domain-containing protein [Deltaproteobacteria bacterium]
MSQAPARGGWLAVAVGVAAWSWLTAPALGFFDAGELAAAAVEPGVPHPTGFPLLLLAGQAARLLPLGTLAGKIHLLGTIATVAAAVLLAQALTPSSWPRRTAWLWWSTAALAGPLAGAVALHARQTEVYPLALLHAALVALAWTRTRGGARLAAMVVLAALGATIHAEAVGLGAAGVLGAVAVGDARRPRGDAVLVGALAGMLAAGGLFALPLIALRRPALDWGGVDAIGPLLDHLSGASIRTAFADRIGVAPHEAAWALGRDVWADLGPAALLGVLGGVLAWRGARPGALALIVMAVLDALWAIVVNPMGIRDQQVGLLLRLGLTLFAALAIWSTLARHRLTRLLAPALAALALVATATARPNATLEAAARHGDALLDALPAAGLAVAAADHTASACLWLQAAEGARPDARCLPLVFARSGRMLGRIGERLGEPSFVAAAAAVQRAGNARERAAALGGWLRPYAAADALRWEPGRAFEDAQVAGALRPGVPWGEVGLAAAATVAEAAEAMAVSVVQRCAEAGAGCAPETPLRRHHADGLAVWGALLLRRGDADGQRGARALLEAAVRLDARRSKALHNLAVVRLAEGDAQSAAALAMRALVVAPDYRPAWRSAARAALRSGDADRAVHAAQRALGPRPGAGERRWLASLLGEASPELAARLQALLPAP